MKTDAPLKMTELDCELQQALHRRRELGVVDIKCHVDVTGTTDPKDFKRALLNVFGQYDKGELQRVRLSSLRSFDELCKQIS
jgi:hypothetical protein